ncbi:hypothetical protein TAMA11512_03410 [Selenomonas sp. TAMA-11512]|nr:hypothetical protein TAMA11512_03410 [Selenomonas sp. TAMA-11512]
MSSSNGIVKGAAIPEEDFINIGMIGEQLGGGRTDKPVDADAGDGALQCGSDRCRLDYIADGG